MKRKWITVGLLAGGILAAALLLLLLARLPARDGGGETADKYPITSFSLEDAAAIQVKNTKGEVYTIRLDGGAAIEGVASGVPLRGTMLFSAVKMLLQGVSYSPPLPAERREEYGLDDPRAVFTVQLKDGTSAALRMGNETVKRNGVYLWPEDGEEVYVAEYAYETLAGYGVFDYVDPTLAEIDQSNGFTISRLTLANRAAGTELAISRKTGAGSGPSIYSYQVAGLDVYDAADDKLNAYLFDRLAPLRAERVYSLEVSEENLERLGLNDPAYTLTFSDDRQGDFAFRFSRPEEGTVLCMAEGVPAVYQLSEADAAFLELTLDQVVSPFLILQDIAELERFTVYGGGEEYAFDLRDDPETGELLVACRETGVDTASFRKLYGQAAAIYIQGMAEPPEEAEPVLRLVYGRRDGEVHTVEFFDLDGRRCFAALDGRGEFYVRLTDIEQFLESVSALAAGE